MDTKEFIEKAKIIHNSKYIYSKTIYVNSRTKIVFECPIHGIVKQNPRSHLNSCGCQHCASNKMTSKEFIKKAQIIHNNKYDYCNLKYKNAREKIEICCKIHGEFQQRASAHLEGQGCPKCAFLSPKRYKRDKNHFVKLSKQIHGDKYDYSKTVYGSSNKKVKIICPIHGEFQQRASAHTSGQGCHKCNNHNRISLCEFINKSNKIHNNKYSYLKADYKNLSTKITIICPIHGEFKQKAYSHVTGQGCLKCGYESMRSNLLYSTSKFIKLAQNIHNKKYNYSEVDYVESKKKVKILCKKHGEFYQRPNDHLVGNGCPKCVGTHLQNEIFEFVSSLILANYNNKEAIKPYEIDIFIPSKKIGIEVNGLYWHSFNKKESIKERNKHSQKCNICEQKDINLIQINENEWHDKKNIVKSIIKSKLGFSQRIYARKCQIIKLDNQQYKNFCVENHLQGYKNSSIKYGLKHNDELISVMSFNKHPKHEWEITRFANKLETSVVGGASKLFKQFLKDLNPNQILTYADRRYSNGNLYKQLGFKLNGVTKPNYVYVKGNKIFSRQQFQKHKLKDKLEIFDQNLTESENMFLNGFRRMWDAGHYKFIFYNES